MSAPYLTPYQVAMLALCASGNSALRNLIHDAMTEVQLKELVGRGLIDRPDFPGITEKGTFLVQYWMKTPMPETIRTYKITRDDDADD
jgi:hypothetical protein